MAVTAHGCHSFAKLKKFVSRGQILDIRIMDAIAGFAAAIKVSTGGLLLPYFNKYNLERTSLSKRLLCSVQPQASSIAEVLGIAIPEKEFEAKSFDLQGFQQKVESCNRGREKKSEFLPFIIERSLIGYVHSTVVQYLKEYQDIFALVDDFDGTSGNTGQSFVQYITLNDRLKTPSDRTEAVGVAVKKLHKEGMIKGLRNELYPVAVAFGEEVLFCLERAAVPYFGTKAYGVHMNGYVQTDGEEKMWVGKRSLNKETFPGMLDHLVAGGLPVGISCDENLLKECNEEAAIPRYIAERAIPTGAISYEDIDGVRMKRDVLFCYDLQLPNDFQPMNKDGEVESFLLLPVSQIVKLILNTQLFKPNCVLVIIDFLYRHGYINPRHHGYLKLIQSLHSGECS